MKFVIGKIKCMIKDVLNKIKMDIKQNMKKHK